MSIPYLTGEIIPIALIVGDVSSLKTMTLLAPRKLGLEQLSQLAQCEHIDLVIVHESTTLIEGSLDSLVGTLINLGEHVFVVAETRELEEVFCKSSMMKRVVTGEESIPLFYSYKPKKYLTYTRFTQRDPSQRQYKIKSTCTTKQFIKEGGAPFSWVHGINLVTFIMLNGVCHSNERIKKKFLSFKTRYSQHTDLVVGNIIVQDDNLIPIDITDARRRAPLKGCIAAAVLSFDKPRSEDPRKWLNEYYQELNKTK